MRINRVIVKLCLIFTISIYGQESVKSNLDKILNEYLEQISVFNAYSGCGHFIDGPSAFAKNLERNTLDNFLSINQEEEKKIGEFTLKDIKKKDTILNTHKDYDKLKDIINKLSPYTLKKKYNIYIIKSDKVNAFATIGGNIYVYTGLLDFVENNDELAFIIAHEIAHIDEEHVVRKYKKLMMLSNLTQLFGKDEKFSQLALSTSLILSAPFDHIDEYDADKQGLKMHVKAGYDPLKGINFFKKLENSEDKDIFQKLFTTHPFPEDRKNCLNELIKN